jgi:hypothetical protein
MTVISGYLGPLALEGFLAFLVFVPWPVLSVEAQYRVAQDADG